MTYLQVNRRPHERLRQAVIVLIVGVVVVVAILQLSAPHLFPSLVTAIAGPFWRAEFSIESGMLKSPEALLNEKEALTRQLTEAQVRLEAILAIEQENAELKALLGRNIVVASSTIDTLKNPEGYILAAVLKRPPLAPYDELIIDIGRDHKLSTTGLVYASAGVLIGRVSDVLRNTARVRLFSSPGEKFEVLIGTQHAPATAIGRGGGQYEAQISREVTVKEGDFVVNSSLGNKPFGVVSAVLQDPTLPFATVLFAPPVNLYQLRWVLIEN